ncbi:MAG: hypothetical protein EHM35_02285 [Planctomycetaceae bacterium]|nr:MAG: hypothetical protein EHM35_02285 [Planctomycetaceae bacterium]
MIKAAGISKDGRHFVLIGLSNMNISRLREGKPLHIFGAELGTSHDIIIAWGNTEDDITKELRPYFGRDPDRQVKQ